MDGQDDDTVRLKVVRASSSPHRLLPWALVSAVVALAAASGTWWFLQPAPGPSPQAVATAAGPAQAAAVAPAAAPRPAPAASPEQATPIPAGFAPPAAPVPPGSRAVTLQAEILADSPDTLTVYRFMPIPGLLVVQFPSMHEQALTLNRVAALIEKVGFPRDRVGPRADLDARIVGEGGSPDTFYYGHDYRAADLARFFQLATDLDPDEGWLKQLVHQVGWDAGVNGALISLVRLSPAYGLDAAARSAVLQHELSHGVYFTNPAYAEFCGHFWRDVMTGAERTAFTEFLGREGYDGANGDLLINETQAYMMHTPDRRFFSANEVGIAPARLNELRQIFFVGMPPGWLRDHTRLSELP